MDVINLISACSAPVLLGVVVWFLKRHVEQTDKSIEALKLGNNNTAKELTQKVSDLTVKVEVVSTKLEDSRKFMEHFSTETATNLLETRQENLRFQNKMADSSAIIIGQGKEVGPKLDAIDKRLENQSIALKAAGKIMAHHQTEIQGIKENFGKIFEYINGKKVEIGKKDPEKK